MIHSQQALFETFAAPLIGLPVAHAWQGYGSAIFLEFGALTPSKRRRRDGSLSNPVGNPDGEMGLMIEWDWRIEGKRSILCGSSTDKQRWPRALACLTKSTVVGAALFGRLLEIDLALSSGVHVASFMTDRGDPEWTLFDRRASISRWTYVRRGLLHIESGTDPPSPVRERS